MINLYIFYSSCLNYICKCVAQSGCIIEKKNGIEQIDKKKDKKENKN